MTNSSTPPADNPYAPPAVVETEASPSLGWHVDGTGVLVKHGTTLPQVDLDTGACEGPMKSVKREGAVNLALGLGSAVVGVAILLVSKKFFDVPFYVVILACWIGQFVYGRLRVHRVGASVPQQIVVWTFMEEERAKRLARRRMIRIVCMVLVFIAMVATPFLLIGSHLDMVTWMLRIFGVGITLLVGLMTWMALDQGKARVANGPPGWLRIERIHPDAITRLAEIERGIIEKEMTVRATRRRLVKTVYYHRFPLKLLIGEKRWRPLHVVNVILMKLLRSRLLERETYHFTEAEEIHVSGLCGALENFAAGWLRNHPDWTVLSARHLPDPAGVMMIDFVFLASPGLEHCCMGSHVWLVKDGGKGTTEVRFFAWTADDQVVSTVDHASVPVPDPQVIGQCVAGPPDAVFEAHLKLCEGHTISPASDAADFLARVRRLMEHSESLLVEAGYQSAVRETG